MIRHSKPSSIDLQTMDESNVILASQAAREWGCSTQHVYNAIKAGQLNEIKMGRYHMLIKDEKYRSFKVREFGGRLHDKYKKKAEDK